MATADQAQAAYDALQDKIAATYRSLRYFNDQLRTHKDHDKTVKMIKALNAQLEMYRKQMPGLQNNLWEATGQYDKLLTGENRDAFMAVNALFKNYGLESLAGKIYEYVKNGYSADTISILLQDTSEYKQRFQGNEARKAAGLPVLSPAEYLSTEASYRQIMQSAGLPSGFYDQPSDFSVWIGKNVSPSEIEGRVDLATQATVLSNPSYRKALNQMGIDDAHLTAYFLDPNKAMPILQKSAATAQIGAEALSQGLSFDQSYAELLATSGVTRDQAQSGYSQVSAELNTMSSLGQIYGEQWNQRTSEEALFQGSGEAIKKKGRLLSQERGAFAGSTGGARGGLSSGGGAR
jgi:hypothetical protein